MNRPVASLTLAAAALLAACSTPGPAPQAVVYDLGPPPAAAVAAAGQPLRLSEVSAPAWLDHPGMAYRLAYRDAQRRELYRDSHWAAPPAELLAQRLREGLHLPAPACPAQAAQGASLAVSLEEFEQVFSSAESSEVVLRLSARLTLQPSAVGPTERRWTLTRPAPSPDARGAARGLASAVDALAPALQAWVNSQRAPCP
jgi:cholesterol transport system auxiliary component